MTQKTFQYNNGSIAYSILGSDVNPVLVFIHGFSLDSTMWDQQVEYFSKKYKVIAYDLRGFSIPIAPYSHHDDLYNLLKHLQIKRAHLIGSSFGGEVALDFTLVYSDMVKSLALVDSSLGGYASTVDWDVHAKEEGMERAKQNWIHHGIFAATRKNKIAFATLQRIIAHYSGWSWMQDDFWKYRQRLQSPAFNRLHEISVSTLILLGEEDIDYFHTLAQILVEGIPSAEKIVIKHSGHMVNLEQPQEFNRCFEKFLMVV